MRGLLFHIQSLLTKVTASSLQGRAGRGSFILLLLLCTIAAQAQISIGGNVYGGGNKGKVNGNTSVTVMKVDTVNSVFGGARMADVGGRAFVNIDGEHATGDIVIPTVYGGNDVAGTIGTYGDADKADAIPSELTEATENHIDNTWNAFVRTSRSVKSGTTDEDKWIIIGTLFGGGNGDFTYTEDDGVTPLKDGDDYLVKEGNTIIARNTKPFVRPDLGKTYLEIKAGDIAHVYGGGNYATVTGNTTIYINNESDVCQGYVAKLVGKAYAADNTNSIEYYTAKAVNDLKAMSGLNTFQSNITSFNFTHARVFGGNNKADMAIQPTWNLQRGIIRDLYSGGNEGRMTCPSGLLLEISPTPDDEGKTDHLVIENVYGGCRRSDVRPLDSSGEDVTVGNPDGYNFPIGLSARTLVRGGHITNVYGGNDISGRVYGGSAVGIYTTVYGDVYGGGNGSYAYTDNPILGAMDIYKDFYYPVPDGKTSVEALKAFRPNAEQVSVRLKGKGPRGDMTIIHGGVYCGGNCASMDAKLSNPLMEIKIGSYVTADNVYLGNNGENMKDTTTLKLYAKYVDDEGNILDTGTEDNDYSTLDLKTEATFADYMDGVVMTNLPDIVFDGDAQTDKDTYIENSSYVGSFYCGGNVGSMAIPGFNSYSISHRLNVYDKFVGGCFNADIGEQFDKSGTKLNAAYKGGILGAKNERGSTASTFYTDDGLATGNIKDRLEINLENLTITPLRWNDDKTQLIWNTNKWEESEGVKGFVPVANSPVDEDTRLLGGNVYGGCYNSGHVNGNVVININEDVLNRDAVFDTGTGPYGNPASGVLLEKQRVDEMAVALSVFGAGYGEDTEIWGSTTLNLNKGYVFQVFGGGEKGIVGKKNDSDEYVFDPRYSSTVNLKGLNAGYKEGESGLPLAETEYIYGGGSEGDVCGNSYVNLGNGRVYDVFGGASDADILGHSEVHIGRQPNGSGGYQDGFPWITDIVYGGNDFGGTIWSKGNFKDRVRVETGEGAFNVLGKVHNPGGKETPDVLQANAYVEYLQGRVDSIFGGSYGNYDYDLPKYKDEAGNSPELPYVESTFVNIRPNTQNNSDNRILGIFGGGTGCSGNRAGDRSQNRSYVLIDIPDNLTNFRTTEIFGAGSFNGLGMNSAYDSERHVTVDAWGDEVSDLDNLSAIIDLVRGKVGAAYGGSYMEGVTRRTMVNVPRGSTINIGSIFGGAYGNDLLAPCDVYEAHVNYSSTDAILNYKEGNALMKGAIYGGNNACRRTLYGFIDIDSPVWQQHPDYGKTRATVYGAGCGPMTWSEYTEVNLNKKPDGVTGDYTGAEVFEVYGGAQNGEVLNAESAKSFMNKYLSGHGLPQYLQTIFNDRGYTTVNWSTEIWPACWTLGKGYYYPYTESGTFDVDTKFDGYSTNEATNLSNPLVRTEEMDDRDESNPKNKATNRYKYNTNVRIHEGAYVANYAYGGGLGTSSMPGSGDVYGTTYIALLGGTVKKDIYAAGTVGAVHDNYESKDFIASSNVYIKGGMCRNVYGGGWEGSVGKHTKLNDSGVEVAAGTVDSPANDIYGEAHVVIGRPESEVRADSLDLAAASVTKHGFFYGRPAIQRNAYGGGEGGAVYGTAHLTLNNGYVGYVFNPTGSDDAETTDFDERYEEKSEDDTKTTPNTLLKDAGCMFGGGYIDNSSVDKTSVKVYDGHVRGSVFGGGEIAAVGRGTMRRTTTDGKTTYSLEGIYRPGKTNIEMFGGQVHRNVYGGGRGSDNLGGHGSLYCDGYVFGQTEVHIHGGEVGTKTGVADGNGNVFGAGDEGYVYSAYENTDGSFGWGVKSDVRYGGKYQGYYYKHLWNNRDDEESKFLHENGDERIFTEDCKVLVEPHMKVTGSSVSFTDIKYTKGEIVSSEDMKYLKSISSPLLADIDINNHVTADYITFSRSYPTGAYVPIAALNTLKNKNEDSDKDKWAALDSKGIIIHNAVFAGGNTPAGSLTTSANTATVFGNATASVNDIYHRDMITLGTRHTGGLYGDGNLTLVDGYRELNITNYGTDYYSIAKEIDINTYNALPDREAAYYELNYTCMKECRDRKNTVYMPAGEGTKAATITADDLLDLFLELNNSTGKYESYVYDGKAVLIWNETKKEWEPNPDAGYWKESGVLPVYAGRLMNSIQRADFCGVFGSRMVMQGAQDRVPEEVDYTNYTINRVREVSLNKKNSVITGDAAPFHGNYFGIYNIVNYLGALTSDVDFGDDTNRPYARTTDNTSDDSKYKCTANGQAYNTASFYDWKKEFPTERQRNNGNSHNKVALASGVYLELTTEESTGTGLYEKVWGPITGVVELDLINVAPGIGGGFVYAKNQHGVRSKTNNKNTTLTALNDDAVTQWDFTYSTTENSTNQMVFETSGNFVHSSQTIIDDCYNVSNRYMGEGKMPAHYWYIKGSVYVYDQYISAFTGTPNAFSETVDIPLTIAAASHGKMKLLNVQPNRYAYYASPGVVLNDDQKIIINDKEYYKNDPISYWDWYLLSNYEKELFVAKTYVNCITCKIDGMKYEAGTYIMTDTEFATYKAEEGGHTYTDNDNHTIQKADKTNADDDYIFRLSNNVGHDTGYILTYEVNNPSQWDNWYTPKTGSYTAKKTLAEYDALVTADVTNKDKYYDGPTYRLNSETGKLLGQRDYKVGDLISESVETTYQAITNKPSSGQAVFEEAYIVPDKITYTDSEGVERHYYPGAAVSKTVAQQNSINNDNNLAYICTKSVQVSTEEIIYKDTKMSKSAAQTYVTTVETKMGNTYKSMTLEQIKALPTTGTGAITAEKKKELTELATLRDDLNTYLVPAYYCTTAGKYGGDFYETNKNYRALEAWSSMSKTDHDNFVFNYDALDLLIDKDYSGTEGQKYQYDGAYTTAEEVKADGTGNKAGYSVPQSVDYTATYNGKDGDLTETEEGDNYNKKYITVSETIVAGGKVYAGDELTRDQYEALPNEQRNYAQIAVKSGVSTYYVVNTAFQVGATPYAIGEVISGETYNSLPDKSYVTALTFATTPTADQTIYYCRESHTPSGDVTTYSSSEITGASNGADGSLGTIISSTQYSALPNLQKGFTIHGISPTETSTLFVSRESDIYDLSKEKIITVIYEYDYDETDGNGNVTPISERHVLNIHLTFKSGVPTVENITKPDIILPGDIVGLREPIVKSGAYEVTGGGWELFERESDAESHTNGVDFTPSFNPLYWYQDGYYVAYYAKSYLGRTYSNHVPVSVANYHDLAEVMSDANKAHHMYIDNKNVKRAPKIYINDYSDSGENGLDLFKNLYDLSLRTTVATSGDLEGHATLDSRVRAGTGLEFFLRTDIDHSGPSGSATWTPIASGSDPCFNGILHGDGHTISGLNPATGTTGSLFGKLCGSVYNLGVTGSFTGGGVVDEGEGYVESCWVKTTGTPAVSTKAVFGNPTASDGGEQVVNCYYPESNSGYTAGNAIQKSDRAFYNGEVAYDLNNFYLYKRYNDHTVTSGEGKVGYRYFTIGDDDKLVLQPMKYYDSHPSLCSSGYIDSDKIGLAYVEDRFEDGDYRYAGGRPIRTDEDERHWLEDVEDEDTHVITKEDRWSPIWPDDYLFFGQMLTYGHSDTEAHQELPSAIVKNDNNRLLANEQTNRVYRAPAYFGSHTMGAAHFNPNAYLAQTKKGDSSTKAYSGMTAIDFKGHYGANEAYGTYGLGNATGLFYTPLLDDDGLQSISNCDETRNLLAYAPAAADNAKTNSVLTDYFVEPAYTDYYDNSDGYRLVRKNDMSIYGHLVQNDLTATNDHLLVDKQDFNCPIGYDFLKSSRETEGTRMWYQRIPEETEYVTPVWTGTKAVRSTTGWQGVSIPFTAELVTTNEKGEITHFYNTNDERQNSKNGTNTKIGHEYWLREFKAGGKESDTDSKVYEANMSYPEAGSGSKSFTNTFLWDYYYKKTDRKDANDDTYQDYYSSSHTYTGYPLLTGAKPYIIGLPGDTYYEFDLSGKFEAKNTKVKIDKLGQQTITFASDEGISIGVSDTELSTTGSVSDGSYVFQANYANKELPTGNFVLNSDGNAYHQLSATPTENTANKVTTSQYAFRPYFTVAPGGARVTRSIVFTNNGGDEIIKPNETHETDKPGTLHVSSGRHKILVTSALKTTVTVRIVNTSGITLNTFDIKPGETIETRVNSSGVYMVQSTDGQFIKKISVR